MTAIGGPIVEVNIGGRGFPATADANAQRSLGGYQAEKLPNGDQSARTKLTPFPWYINSVTIECDDDRDDQRYLQQLVNAGADVPITVTFTSNAIYQGVGLPVGALEYVNETTSIQCNLSGGGELTKQ
jgi:hypothetical protein